MVFAVPYFPVAPTHTKNLNKNKDWTVGSSNESNETSTRRSETSDRVTS